MIGLLTNFKILGSLAGLAAIATGVLLYTQSIKSSARAELQLQLQQQRDRISQVQEGQIQEAQAKYHQSSQDLKSTQEKLNAVISGIDQSRCSLPSAVDNFLHDISDKPGSGS